MNGDSAKSNTTNPALATESSITTDLSASGPEDVLDVFDDIEGTNLGTIRRTAYGNFDSIDWIHEHSKERIRRQSYLSDTTLRGVFARVWDQNQTWAILIVSGLAVGVIAATIDIVSTWLGDLKDGYCVESFYLSKAFCCWGLTDSQECHDWTRWGDSLSTSSSEIKYIVSYFFYVAFAVLLAGSASLLVSNYAPYASHSGIPEVKTMLSGVVIRRLMGIWTLTIKSVGLCLAVASGLWLGKEGPLVHVAVCCGSVMMKLFPAFKGNEARRREIISAVSAAGMCVAFGTPIGGVLFSLEVASDTVKYMLTILANIILLSRQDYVAKLCLRHGV